MLSAVEQLVGSAEVCDELTVHEESKLHEAEMAGDECICKLYLASSYADTQEIDHLCLNLGGYCFLHPYIEQKRH